MEKSGTEILIIIPQLPETSWLNSAVAGVTPPLGAAYLAAYCRERGLSVAILDNCVELKSPEDVALAAAALSPRLIGLTSTTTTYPAMLDIARALKKALPGTPLVAGGPHPSALPEETLSEETLDFVAQGEGEETLYGLARTVLRGGSLSSITGLYFRRNGKIIRTAPRPPIADLDSLPLPAYDLLPMDRYHPSLSRRISRGAVGSIITARGCPHQCTFCSSGVFGKKLRVRSPANIIKEAALLKKTYGIKELLVWDDTFTLDRERAKEIARGIKSAAGVPWSCYSRVDDAEDGLYSELAASGCSELLFGAESASNDILRAIKKGITREQTERAVRLCREKGISSFCSVILGLPGDTRETMEETVEFFTRLNPDYAAFCVLIPFPGTELFRDAVAKGLVDPRTADWKTYVKIFSSALPPVSLCGVGREELVKLQKKAFRRFFMRPGYVYGRLAKAANTGFGRRLLSFCRGAEALLRHQLHKFR